MKLTKEEKKELKGYIKFENGVITNQETLEIDLIKFSNKKYRQKYKSDEEYNHIRVETYVDINGEVDRTIPEDNTVIERVSIVLFQESIKDRRARGINVKGEPKTISPICTKDIGTKQQYCEYYQLHGEKIYLVFESMNNYSEDSKTQWQCEQIQAKEYTEIERSVDASVNEIFERYYRSKHKNEVLYLLLIHLNDDQLDYTSREALSFFLQQELKNYKLLNNQQKVLDRILLCGEIPDANQKKTFEKII